MNTGYPASICLFNSCYLRWVAATNPDPMSTKFKAWGVTFDPAKAWNYIRKSGFRGFAKRIRLGCTVKIDITTF